MIKFAMLFFGNLLAGVECTNWTHRPTARKYIKSTFVIQLELFTGNKGKRNIYLYQKMGYKIFKTEKMNTFDNISGRYKEKSLVQQKASLKLLTLLKVGCTDSVIDVA